jgi:hypothetical protein
MDLVGALDRTPTGNLKSKIEIAISSVSGQFEEESSNELS